MKGLDARACGLGRVPPPAARPPSRHARSPPFEHGHVVVPEVAQQPPEPGGPALAGLVVGDHGGVGRDPGAARRGLEVLGGAAAGGARRPRVAPPGRGPDPGSAAPGMCPSSQSRSPAPGSPRRKRQSTTRSAGDPRRSRSQATSRSGPLVMAGLAYGHAGDGAPRRGRAASRGGAAPPAARRRGAAARGERLRRLPHRPPHRRRRAARPQAAARARPPDRRDRRGGRRALRRGRPGRGAVAGVDRRQLPLLPRRAREPLRPGRVHGLRARRRLCAVRSGRRALLLPASPTAIPTCRPHRFCARA